MILPNFLIIGAAKSGTTALASFIRQHPDVCFSNPKETWFFNRRYDKGIKWLSSHFEHYKGESAIGEGSAGLLQSDEAPVRIKKHIPNTKLFCVLRNPIDRAYSHYYFYIFTGKADPDASFSEIIRDELSKFGQDVIRQGFYIEQLKHYEKKFNRDQLNVFLYDELTNNPVGVVQDIYDRLNIDPTFKPNTNKKHNKTVYPKSRKLYNSIRKSWKIVQKQFEKRFPSLTEFSRNKARKLLFEEDKPRMKEEDRIYLKKIYEPYNRELEEWLDVNLSHWK